MLFYLHITVAVVAPLKARY